jgi:CheY-like chemotaxis protein
MPLSGKRILIVEDNFLVAEDLAEVVRAAGGRAQHVSASEKDALVALMNEVFDGVLLDVQLQEGDSIEVARHLVSRHIPFIVVTGYERERLALKLRHVPYVGKPYGRKELTAMAVRHFA